MQHTFIFRESPASAGNSQADMSSTEFPFSRRWLQRPSAAAGLPVLPSVWSSEEAADLGRFKVNELVPWQPFCCMFILV